jgi:cytochrome c
MPRALYLFVLLAGCGQSPGSTGSQAVVAPSPTAAGFRGSEAQTAEVYLRTPEFAAADQHRGELLSLACQACHTLAAGEPSLLGPNLYGIFGTVSATAGDFDYSLPLREAEIVWTPSSLDAWLADPSEFLPGNNMAFSGYNSASDRRDLIAFLLRKTAAEIE